MQEFWSHTGKWSHHWNENIPSPVSEEELDVNCMPLTLAEVREWVETHKNLEGRFCFFDVHKPNSVFYQRVTRHLLSMRITGSIDVEQVAKPFKRNLLRKERNRLSDEKDIFLFRATQNLKYLTKAKMAAKGTIYDVIN